MRKSSDRARRGRLACLALLIALFHPAPWLYSQTILGIAAAKNTIDQDKSSPALGFARFVELKPEARSAVDAPHPPKSVLMELDSSTSGSYSPLAVSLSLTARSTLDVLPKPADGGFLLKSPSPDNQLYPLNEETLKTVGNIVFGLYSQSNGLITADLYLVSAEKDNAEKLGTYSGSVADLDASRKAYSGFLIPRFSNSARRIIDFIVTPQGATISLPVKTDSVSKTALLLDGRLFIYGDQTVEVSIERKGYVTQRVLMPQSLDDVYSIIQIVLAADSAPGVPAAVDLKEATSRLDWKDGKDYPTHTARFSSAMGRLVISLPVTALALGVFFLGYEGYSRSAITTSELILRGGFAVLSVGLSIGFAVDTGIGLAGLIAVAQ